MAAQLSPIFPPRVKTQLLHPTLSRFAESANKRGKCVLVHRLWLRSALLLLLQN